MKNIVFVIFFIIILIGVILSSIMKNNIQFYIYAITNMFFLVENYIYLKKTKDYTYLSFLLLNIIVILFIIFVIVKEF